MPEQRDCQPPPAANPERYVTFYCECGHRWDYSATQRFVKLIHGEQPDYSRYESGHNNENNPWLASRWKY
jgi:hypothetical protein